MAPTWIPELASGFAITAVFGLGLVAFRYRHRWLGWAAAFVLVCVVVAVVLFLVSPRPMPGLVLAVPWPAFLVGAVTGGVIASALVRASGGRGPKVADLGLLWRSLTPHEVSFLRRVWRVGFILEEDDALRREARPDRLHATLHSLEESRRLVYLNKVRGGSGALRAFRLTAAGKDLMTWVTNQGK